MKGDAHTPADEIFNAALELDTAQREVFLRVACARQSGLQEEVQSLLDAYASAEGFLEKPLMESCLRNAEEIEGGDFVGTMAGPYRLVSLIASGGMGAVYKGRREGSSFHRDVAIKLIRKGMSNDAMRRCFHRERQALACLEHPYIATLIDGGDTGQGFPYLVMELICGLPITEYCDQHRLNIHDRLRLFCKVCEAVHFAHCNLVIHRDLKPGNILVTSEGNPKLLDFGIARLIGADAAVPGGSVTQTALPLMTPRYASPEQIRGTVTTTSADVYSLGVILYELLSGRSPYDLDGKTRYEQDRIICEVPPTAPSDSLRSLPQRAHLPTLDEIAGLRSERPSRLGRILRGDLDKIGLTALHKDPSRRYASVQQFKEDVERYLAGMPIIARKDTLRYRLQKYVSRNKAASIATAAFVMALLAAVIGTSTGMIRARSAQIEAQKERNAAIGAESDSRAVTSFLQDLFAAANPYRQAREVTVHDLLDDAERRMAGELTERPAVEAGVRFAIAKTYAGMWEWDKAVPHLRIALSINRRLYGSDDRRVADCLSILGRALTFARDTEAIAIQEEGLAIRRRLYGDKHPDVAESTGNLGFALWHAASPPRWAQAEPLYRKALTMYQESGVQDSPDVARFTFSLGVMLAAQGRLVEAESLYVKSLNMYARLPVALDRYRIECMRNYAGLLQQLDRTQEAEDMLRQTMIFSPKSLDRTDFYSLGWAMGTVQTSTGKYQEGLDFFRSSLIDGCRRLAHERPAKAPMFDRLADAMNSPSVDSQVMCKAFELLAIDRQLDEAGMLSPRVNFATALHGIGDDAVAVRILAPLELSDEFREATPLTVAFAQNLLGACLMELGEWERAQPLLDQSYNIIRSVRGVDHPQTRLAAQRLDRLHESCGL